MKAELEPFLPVGETFACELGKLTKAKGSKNFSANAEGKVKLETYKDALIDLGLAEYVIGKPSLRLTLKGEKES